MCTRPGPCRQAFAGDDWFEVAIGLYDDSSNLKGCKVYRGNAMDDYTDDFFDIPSNGNYKLGFFAGSYDRTGGTALGATLKVKAFQMTAPALHHEATLQHVASGVAMATAGSSRELPPGPEAAARTEAAAKAPPPHQPDEDLPQPRRKPAPRLDRNRRALQPAGRPGAPSDSEGRPIASAPAASSAALSPRAAASRRADASTSLAPARFVQKEWIFGEA